MGFGVQLRTKPRVQVLRGYDPMNPTTLTAVAAPGEVILSGQLVSKVWNGSLARYEFVLGNDDEVIPYISWSDSADQDVIESGKLTALSCSGQFEIQTAFYDVNDGASPANVYVYNEGTPLTWSTANPGNVKPAATGDLILGHVSRVHGPLQKNDPANNFFESSVTSPANSKVIIFQTSFAGAAKPA